jgi:hypothetical protein
LTAKDVIEPSWTNVNTYIKTAVQKAERDGHIAWTAIFAKGVGVVSSSREYKHNNRLVLYRTTSLSTSDAFIPATPASEKTGTVVLVSKTVRRDSGYFVYEYSWAEGLGEISRDTETKNNGALTLRNIKYLTAAGASEPAPADIGTYVQFSVGKQEADGYIVWSFQYALAGSDGEISREVDWSQGATQSDETKGVTRTTIRYIVASPPSSRIRFGPFPSGHWNMRSV